MSVVTGGGLLARSVADPIFTFTDCLAGSINIKVKSTQAEAVLSVTDTGCGIAPEELNLVFERFHRVETTSRTTTGTGIGVLAAFLFSSFQKCLTSFITVQVSLLPSR